MNKEQKARYELRAAVLKALAHPSRLYMLEHLAQGTLCVKELTEMTGLDISTVSRHLSILKNSGLVSFEKKGKKVLYSLRMRCALLFLDCVEKVLKEQARDRLNAINQ